MKRFLLQLLRILRAALILSFTALAEGCVISGQPLLGPDSRVLLFPSGTRFVLYERDRADAPWKLNNEEAVLIADADKIVRNIDDAGKINEREQYTFHPLEPDRFLVQGRFGAERYAYGVLDVRGNEGILTALQCKSIDPALLRNAVVRIEADDCVLDGTAEPVEFLKRLAARPLGPQIKYVPVQKK